jgi:ribosomal protein L7/L12
MHLEQEGTCGVVLSSSKDRIYILKVMRAIFDLPMSEARSLLKSGSNIFTIGTKAEAYYAQDMLRAYSVTTEIVRVDEC